MQVKLRGQRIELGEIESGALRQPDVTDAAALLDAHRLLLFVVPANVDVVALRAQLEEQRRLKREEERRVNAELEERNAELEARVRTLEAQVRALQKERELSLAQLEASRRNYYACLDWSAPAYALLAHAGVISVAQVRNLPPPPPPPPPMQ